MAVLTVNRTIIDEMNVLFYGCVALGNRPGYLLEKHNIVIAFWPRASVMEERYGYSAFPELVNSNTTALSSS